MENDCDVFCENFLFRWSNVTSQDHGVNFTFPVKQANIVSPNKDTQSTFFDEYTSKDYQICNRNYLEPKLSRNSWRSLYNTLTAIVSENEGKKFYEKENI